MWRYGASRGCCPPGQPPCAAGEGAALPLRWPGSVPLLQGSAWARCSGWAAAARDRALSQLEPAAGGAQLPPPRRQRWAGGELPSPGERGKVDVAGERHVDCNLSAGRTFLSEGPRTGAALEGGHYRSSSPMPSKA